MTFTRFLQIMRRVGQSLIGDANPTATVVGREADQTADMIRRVTERMSHNV